MKPSAGALRIFATYYGDQQGPETAADHALLRGIDAEVRPLVEALERLALDGAVICVVDGDLIDSARAALKAWKGEGE